MGMPVLTTAGQPGSFAQAADVAALTDNSGGATADQTIGTITAAAGACDGGSTPTAAQVDTAIATATAQLATNTKDAVKELATQLNLMRTNLRAAGTMA